MTPGKEQELPSGSRSPLSFRARRRERGWERSPQGRQSFPLCGVCVEKLLQALLLSAPLPLLPPQLKNIKHMKCISSDFSFPCPPSRGPPGGRGL